MRLEERCMARPMAKAGGYDSHALPTHPKLFSNAGRPLLFRLDTRLILPNNHPPLSGIGTGNGIQYSIQSTRFHLVQA